MANLKFDWSKFKKTAEDKNSTILTHRDGHSIRLAHNALNPESRKQLASIKLSSGGEIKEHFDPNTMAPMNKEQAKQKRDADLEKRKPIPVPQFAEGTPSGGASKQWTNGASDMSTGAESGGPKWSDAVSGWGEALGLSTPKQTPTPSPTPKAKQNYAEGTPEGGVEAPPAEELIPINLNQSPQLPEGLINQAPGAEAATKAQQAAPQVDPNPQLEDVYGVPKEQQARMIEQAKAPQAAQSSTPQPDIAPPAVMPTPKAPESQDPYGQGAYLNAYTQGMGMKTAGLENQAVAEQQVGAEQAQALRGIVGHQQQFINEYQKHIGDLNEERQHFIKGLEDQHIDPEHYMASRSTGQKIGTAIGLLAGGFAAGTTGGENGAMKYLNNRIQNDIDAQKAEMSKKENLLGMNYKQYGNLRDAQDMTRVMMNDSAVNQMRLAAANAATPQAQANLLKAAGDMQMQSAPVLAQIAMRNTLMSGISHLQNNPDQAPQMIQAYRTMGMNDQAKALEERYVPGVGVATSPVPHDTRDDIISKHIFDREAHRLMDWASKHTGSLSPKDWAVGKAMAAEVSGLYRNATKGGVYKEGEQEFINSIIPPNPASPFNGLSTLPKLKSIIQSNQIKLDEVKKGYGLPSNGSPSSSAPTGTIQFKPAK